MGLHPNCKLHRPSPPSKTSIKVLHNTYQGLKEVMPKIRAGLGLPSAIPAFSQRSKWTTITISDERPRLAAFGPGFSVEPGLHHSRDATRPGSGIQVLSFPHSRSRPSARSPTCPSDGDPRYDRGRWNNTLGRAPRTVDWWPGPRVLEGQDGPSPEIGRLGSPLASASRGGARPGVGGRGSDSRAQRWLPKLTISLIMYLRHRF